jgi:hypothetical protein
MRKSQLAVLALPVLLLTNSAFLVGACDPPTQSAPPPNRLTLFASTDYVNLNYPYDVSTQKFESSFYGEAVDEADNASGTYDTATISTSHYTFETASGYADDRRLPATWRFRPNLSNVPCEFAWGAAEPVPLAGSYHYKCRVYHHSSSVSSVEAGSYSTTWQDGSVPDPTDLGNRLYGDNIMYEGDALVSPSGDYILLYQSDGNLVLYDSSYTADWHTNTVGYGAYAYMQSDGNFVVNNSVGGAVWSSSTSGYAGAYLEVQNDGNLVVYTSGGSPIWSLW